MSGLMIPTTNPPYPPFAKGGKQNHDTATDLPVLTCTPLCKRGAGGDFQRGISLIELIMFIVIVSVALAGILLVMNVTTKSSADPLIHKQALAIAESLLEEVELMPFTFCDPDDANAASATIDTGCAGTNQDNGGGALTTIPAGESRGSANPFDNVADYAGYTINPAADIAGNTYPGYSAAVTITRVGTALMGVADGAALRITVTVCFPSASSCPDLNEQQIVLDGYRTRFSPRI